MAVLRTNYQQGDPDPAGALNITNGEVEIAKTSLTTLTGTVGTLSATSVQATQVQVYAPTVSDAVTDESSIINAAINALPVAGASYDVRGGGRVMLKPGTIRIASPIILKSGVVVEGHALGTTILVDANIEGFTATSADSFGMTGWGIKNLNMMAGVGTTSADAIACHAFGAASGAHRGCTIENVHIRATSGSIPIRGAFARGFVGDFFMKSYVSNLNITGCTGRGIELTNNSNASSFVGCTIRQCSPGAYIAGVSSPMFLGGTFEGNSTCGVDVDTSAPNFFGVHFEQTGGLPDVRINGGGSGNIFGGEGTIFQIGLTTAAHDWTLSDVLIRNSATFGSGCLSGTVRGGSAGTITDNSGKVSIQNVRINGVNTTRLIKPELPDATDLIIGSVTGSKIGQAESRIAWWGKTPLVRQTVIGATDAAKIADLVSKLASLGLIVDQTGGASAPAVTDAFNRTDATKLGAAANGGMWTSQVATWGTNGTQAYVVTHVGNDIAWIETGKSDGIVGVTLPVTSGGGLLFRYVDANNHWLMSNGAGGQLTKRVAGSLTAVGSSWSAGANNDVITVELSGDSITAKRNGTTLATITDAAHNTATKHGLYATSTTPRFDSFTVS